MGRADPITVDAALDLSHLPSATGIPVTTSQHLDKTPPSRWRAVFRRAAPVAGADDARALALANRRILQLEMTTAALRHRLDRSAGKCAAPCWHAARLQEAESAILRLRTEHADVYHRMRRVLGELKYTSPAQARGEESGGGR